MRDFFNAIKIIPHAEERPGAHLEARKSATAALLLAEG
jgi:hypothetical protein